VVVDVRTSAEFLAGHLPNARNIPSEDLAKRAGELPAGKPLIVVCANGSRAGKAAATLRAAGRQDVFCLEGGISGLAASGAASGPEVTVRA
jgi:rhodanese-related sulfurtransferase